MACKNAVLFYIANDKAFCALIVCCAGFARRSRIFPMQIRAHPPEAYSQRHVFMSLTIGLITGEIKNKVDKIWTDIWAGGLTNPLTVIEQLTYLMFIRSLDEKETEMEQFAVVAQIEAEHIFPQSVIGQSMRWSKFKDKDPRIIFDVVQKYVFHAIKNMKNGKLPDFTDDGKIKQEDSDVEETAENMTAFSRYMKDAIFLIPTPQVLQKIVTGLEDLYMNDLEGLDMQGDLYEYMLGKLSAAGQNGQFRTPKHIREMMVQLVDPNPKELVCDPG